MADEIALDQELQQLQSRLEQMHGILPAQVDIQPDNVQRDLARLVMTLIEFIRRLLERQAVRRMEGGGLSEQEIERMGLALMRLEEQMQVLKAQFGLEDDDLSLNLGPLGELM